MYPIFLEEYIEPFKDLSWIWSDEMGYIVWRNGTGGNIELLHIRTFEKRKGYGKILFIDMLNQILEKPPFYSIFGFTRVSNTEAYNFYEALGFSLEKVTGLYKDGECRLFWAPYEELIKKHLEYNHGPNFK